MSWNVQFDKELAADLKNALDGYRIEAGEKLANEFFLEFERVVSQLRDNPRHYSFDRQEIRRANFRRFPYHLLYEIQLDSVWVFVLKHDRRDPNHGIRRQ